MAAIPYAFGMVGIVVIREREVAWYRGDAGNAFGGPPETFTETPLVAMEIDEEDECSEVALRGCRETTLEQADACASAETTTLQRDALSAERDTWNMVAAEEPRAVSEADTIAVAENEKQLPVYEGKYKEEEIRSDTTNALCSANVAAITESQRSDNVAEGEALPEAVKSRDIEITFAIDAANEDTCTVTEDANKGIATRGTVKNTVVDGTTVFTANISAVKHEQMPAEERVSQTTATEVLDVGEKQHHILPVKDKLQAHCYICGSSRINLRSYPRAKNSPEIWLRHRCLEFTCRRFTGDFYIQAEDGAFVVYKRDIKNYPFRHMTEVTSNADGELGSEQSIRERALTSEENQCDLESEKQETAFCRSVQTEEMNAPTTEDLKNIASDGNARRLRVVVTDVAEVYPANKSAKIPSFGLEAEDSETADPEERELSNRPNATGDCNNDMPSKNSDATCKRRPSGRRHTARKQPGCFSRRHDNGIEQNVISATETEQMFTLTNESMDAVDNVVSILHKVAKSKPKPIKKPPAANSTTARKRKIIFGKRKLVKHKYLERTKCESNKQTTAALDNVPTADVVVEQRKRKTRSWGTQTYTYEVIGIPSTTRASACTQTELDKAGVVDLLLDECMKDDVKQTNINDTPSLLRRIKVAQTILYLQNKELRALRQEKHTFKDIQEKVKCAVGEMKKQYDCQLSRVREDISVMTNEFRLYHLDLQRACNACSLKTKEEEKKFRMVASKYDEENQCLKERIAELEKKLELCNDIIYSKTRDLLVADRDVHLANELAASAQKKLEDQLFMATHTKCTSCAVFEKFRDVLTTQIADKTNALMDATRMVNELKVKLEKQERASQIMSKEVNRMKFERDAWMSDSQRLEYEVNSLRMRLGEENLESANSLAPSDTILTGQSVLSKSKDQLVSLSPSSPPSVYSGTGDDKVSTVSINDNSESESTPRDSAPYASQYIKKDLAAVRAPPPVEATERPLENVDAVQARYPWMSSVNLKRHLENKPVFPDSTKDVTNRKSGKKWAKKADADKLLITKQKLAKKSVRQKKKDSEKDRKDAIETRSPLNFYRGPSVFKPKSGFLEKMTGKTATTSGMDSHLLDTEQRKLDSDSKRDDASGLHSSITTSDDRKKDEGSFNAEIPQSHIIMETENKKKSNTEECLAAAKIKPPEQRIRSPSPSFIVAEDLGNESPKRDEQARIRKHSPPIRKRHEMDKEQSQVSPSLCHSRRDRSSPRRSFANDSASSKRTRRPQWHRTNQARSPSPFSGPRSPPVQPFITVCVPPFNGPCSAGPSVTVNEGLDRGAVHAGMAQNLKLGRLEGPIENLRPSMPNYAPSLGSSEQWQIRQDRREMHRQDQCWRAAGSPPENRGAKRICLERDEPVDLSEIRSRTEKLVMSLPHWNGPAGPSFERPIPPGLAPPYRDESSLWRRGQEHVFNGPSSLSASNRPEENWCRNQQEQWNIRTEYTNERRQSDKVYGDRSWQREEHWRSRGKDGMSDRRW